MKIRMLTLGLVSTLAAAPAAAQQVKPTCTDTSRACLLRTAKLYIQGQSRHDASATPFAPRVRCTEQTEIPVTDEKTLRSEINGLPAIAGVRNVRFAADAQAGMVGAFYIIDVAASATEHAYSVLRSQRFRIVRGLITEVEIYNYVDPKLGGLAKPLWPD